MVSVAERHRQENVVVGMSLEVLSSWIRDCRDPKQLDKLVTLVERQRVVIADKAAAKAKRKAGKATG